MTRYATMFERTGNRALGAFLMLGDPGIAECEAYLDSRSASIVVPVHASRRGHPVLIAWKHVPAIMAMASDLGVNAYLREHAAEVQEIPVDESGVLLNLDAPEDYATLQHLESLLSDKVASTRR